MKRLPSPTSWAAVAFCLLFLTIYSPGAAQEMGLDRSLVASGTSPMTRQGSAAARKFALEEALRGAVEQALGQLLPAESIVRFYPLLLDRILKQPMGYVQDYHIIHEGKVFGLYRVTVQTTLYTEGLKRDLRALGLFLAASERPRVVIMVAERVNAEDSWRWWWQVPSPEYQNFVFTAALGKIISARGLVTLDPTFLLDGFPEDPLYQEPLLSDTQGIELAKALGAHVVVLGQVSHQSARADAPAMAKGSLRALSARSRKTLAKVSGTVEVQPAGKNEVTDWGFAALAERLAPHLADGMLAPFVAVSRVPEVITVQVLGVRSYGDLILIKQHLQRTPEVKDIKQIQLKSDSGLFTVVLAGSLDSLRRAFTEQDLGSFTTSAGLSGEDRVIVTIHSKR
jgi:hypothetical protein